MSNVQSELMLEASEAAYALGVFHDFDGIDGYEINYNCNGCLRIST